MTSLVQAFGHSTSFHVNWVGVDESASMKLMLSHLAEYNANSIAFLSGNVNSASAAELFATLQTSTRVMNLMTEPGWTTFGDNSAKRGYHDVMRLFGDKGNRPNALICATDDVAIGALMALNQLGIRVPDEVKVIGSGDSPRRPSPTRRSRRFSRRAGSSPMKRCDSSASVPAANTGFRRTPRTRCS